MPRNGSGTFVRTDGTRTGEAVWEDARDAPVKILAEDHDTHDQDIADALTASVPRNGEADTSLLVMSGPLKMEGNQLRLDADEDTYWDVSTDDIADLYVANERVLRVQNDGSANSKLEIRANEADANQGPLFVLYRDSASPAAADLGGRIRFDGEDDAGNQTTFASITAEFVSVADGFETGALHFALSGATMLSLDAGIATLIGADFALDGLTLQANGVIVSSSAEAAADLIDVTATNASFAGDVAELNADRAANSGFGFIRCISDADGTPDTEFKVLGDGNATADGSFTGSGAGYAEMFEWADGNPDAEDRVGVTLALDGAMIRPALPGDDVIGVITGRPTVVGNARGLKWVGRYERDEFNRFLTNDDGNRVQSDAFDPDAEYVPRQERREWGCVSLLGQEIVRAGQPTDSRWRLMERRGNVELWLIR